MDLVSIVMSMMVTTEEIAATEVVGTMAAAMSFFLPFDLAGGVVCDFAADGFCVSDAGISMAVFALFSAGGRLIWEFSGFSQAILGKGWKRSGFILIIRALIIYGSPAR